VPPHTGADHNAQVLMSEQYLVLRLIHLIPRSTLRLVIEQPLWEAAFQRNLQALFAEVLVSLLTLRSGPSADHLVLPGDFPES
jgi:hypothetical protein